MEDKKSVSFLHISDKWFEIGKDHPEDPPIELAVKFVAYWIAFEAFITKNCINTKKPLNSQIKIERFVERWLPEYNVKLPIHFRVADDGVHADIIDPDMPGGSFSLDYFISMPVFEGSLVVPDKEKVQNYLKMSPDTNRTNSRGNTITDWPIRNFQILNNPETTDSEKLLALLDTVRQVRNNMFHGNKEPSDVAERNYMLVDASQKILYVVLKTVLKYNF